MGFPGRRWGHHPWKCSRNNWISHLVPQSSWQNCDQSQVGLNDLRGLFQHKWFNVSLKNHSAASRGWRVYLQGQRLLPLIGQVAICYFQLLKFPSPISLYSILGEECSITAVFKPCVLWTKKLFLTMLLKNPELVLSLQDFTSERFV